MQKNKLLVSLFALSIANVFAFRYSQESMVYEPAEVVVAPEVAITPAAAPMLTKGGDGIITVDFIYWKPHLDGMEYAVSGINDGGTYVPNLTSVHKGHIHEPNFTGRPGFKVGLGGRFAYDGWDLFAEYTWLAGGSHSNCFHAKHGEGARTALNVVDGYGSINTRALKSGCADWDQNFNEIDLMLGRNFFISRHLTLRPSVGFKGAYIQEKLDMHFKMTPDAATMLSAKQHRHQNMWGIGTRFGLDGVWHFKTNWGVYGNIYATALWSHFDTTAKDIVVDIPPGGAPYVTSTNLYTTGSIREVIPVLETSIGFTYLRWFHHNKRQFQIQLGWEEQIFIHFNHFMDLTRDGNLSLHGLTLRLGVML